MNWLKMGSELARLVIPTLLSLLVVLIVWRKVMLPEFQAKYAEASATITNLAKLAGVKSQEYTGVKKVEKAVVAELIKSKIPEIGALKMILPEDTYQMLEDFVRENPEQAALLYEKYKHLIPGGGQQQETYMF